MALLFSKHHRSVTPARDIAVSHGNKYHVKVKRTSFREILMNAFYGGTAEVKNKSFLQF